MKSKYKANTFTLDKLLPKCDYNLYSPRSLSNLNDEIKQKCIDILEKIVLYL